MNKFKDSFGSPFSFYRFTFQNEYGIIKLSYRGEHYVKSLD
ncbi:small outer capsid protein [Escherichia phage APTC-EC-2A]|nr:small outer capsid protein [Escherichia phage APTC-EC-2A]